jgi:tRNA pseudouridine38-40 synthase
MVRRLVGVIVEVGRGGLEPEDMTRLLASRSELPAKLTAPASGLFLEQVDY